MTSKNRNRIRFTENIRYTYTQWNINRISRINTWKNRDCYIFFPLFTIHKKHVICRLCYGYNL